MSTHVRLRRVVSVMSTVGIAAAALIGLSSPAQAYPKDPVWRYITQPDHWDQCLTGGIGDGAEISMRPCKYTKDPYQLWMIYRVGTDGNSFKLRNNKTQKCLDMESISKRMRLVTHNAKIFTTGCNDNSAQVWKGVDNNKALYSTFVNSRITNAKWLTNDWGWKFNGPEVTYAPKKDSNGRFIWYTRPDYPTPF